MSQSLIEICQNNIDTVEAGIASKEEVLGAIDFVTKLGEVYRELKKRMDAAAIAYIQLNGDINIGTRRFYVTAGDKKTKCLDARKVYDAVMELAGGNKQAVFDCLCSEPWKPAATMKLLGDDAPKFFETTRKPKLNVDGEPEPVLNSVDSRFLGA